MDEIGKKGKKGNFISLNIFNIYKIAINCGEEIYEYILDYFVDNEFRCS